MAEERLSPRALAAVRDLLGHGVSLEDISTWADQQRSVPGSAPWHYVNVPLSEPRYDAKYCPAGGCVVSKVEDFRRVLRDPKSGRPEKTQALKFLVHFIQDLRCPMHVGDTGSRGGNLIQIRFFTAGSNRYRLWDSQLIEWRSRDEAQWLGELDALASSPDSETWSKGTVEDWATDTLEAAKTAYCLPGTKTVVKSGTKIRDEYCQAMLPLARIQLAKAGMRLAAVLNDIFK